MRVKHQKPRPLFQLHASKSKAENRVAPPSLFETEETSIEADNAFLYVFINRLPYAPSVACSLYDELRCYAVFASEPLVGFLVQFSPRLDVADVAESLLHHAEEHSIGFPEQPYLSPCRLKKVQRQTLLRRHPQEVRHFNILKRFW